MDDIKTPHKIEISKKIYINEDISSLQDEAIENLKDNKDIYSKIQLLGLTNGEVKKNLGTILTYYEDAIVCQKCPGIDKCPKEHPCFEFGLTKENGFVSVTRSPCRLANERMKFESYYIAADFDKDWLGKGIDTVNKTAARKPLLLQMAKILSNQTKEWLYIRGNFNSGRTYLMTAFSFEFAETISTPIAFCDTPKLVDDLKNLDIKNKELFNKKINALSSCPLLVLDGFGNEFKSDFNFSQVIYPLLSERFRKGLLTTFTSDFSVDEVIDMYASKIGAARARQLKGIFDAAISKEFVLEGIKLY